MHPTHPNAHSLISCKQSIQKESTTGNHDYRSQDEANSSEDRIDCHVVCSLLVSVSCSVISGLAVCIKSYQLSTPKMTYPSNINLETALRTYALTDILLSTIVASSMALQQSIGSN